jgi:hydrogenase maturation protease
MKKQNKLAIVGIGNELCKDDGFGILAIKRLEESKFDLGTLIEGGTSGLSLIPLFFEYENIIFLDILKVDDLPGSIYIIPLEKLKCRITNHVSFHDIGLEDAYKKAKMLGSNAKGYLIGIVPKDYSGIGKVSDILESKMDLFLKEVINLSKRIISES